MLEIVDYKIRQHEAFRSDVAVGLSAKPKTLPSRWLYDDRGSQLFEEITQLEEYYPTRTETAILRQQIDAIADFCGSGGILMEYGAGAGIKTEIVLEALAGPTLYVPIDIAGDFLGQTVERTAERFPDLDIQPIVADFTMDFEIPANLPKGGRIAFFPGSTIGNLDREEAASFLRRLRRHTGAKGKALIGIDLTKSPETLIAAYDDRSGVTAAFNLNLLARANRELGSDFDLAAFAHEARWNARESAIEMHLVSLARQCVTIDGLSFAFERGETIHTESSRKYSVDGFTALVESCRWQVARVWQDDDRRFAVFALTAS